MKIFLREEKKIFSNELVISDYFLHLEKHKNRVTKGARKAMSVSYWLDGSKDERIREFDIAVVGGGIAGASVAYHLKNSGYKVALLEAKNLASGASGRNAGFLLVGLSEYYNRARDLYGAEEARLIWDFTRENHELLIREILPKAKDCAYRRCGSVLLACSENEFFEQRATYKFLSEDNYPLELWDKAEIKKILKTDAFYGGIFNPLDGIADPVMLVREIARLSEAEIFEQTEVFAIDFDEKRSALLRTNNGTVKCEMAVLATNAYLPLLLPFFQNKVYPVRGQVLATSPINEKLFPRVFYANFGYEYFTQLENGSVIMGGFRESAKKTEVGYSDETTADVQEGLETFLKEKFPALPKFSVTHRWSGVMGFSRDGLPFAGSLPWAPNVMFIGGFTGHGFGFAFHLAKVLAETILYGKSPGIFSAERFTWQE